MDHITRGQENVANMDKDKRDLAKAETVYETGEIITKKVYKVSPEQKEGLDELTKRGLITERKMSYQRSYK